MVLARRSIPSSPTTPRSISIRPTACRSRACSTSRAGFATSSTRSAPSACRRRRAPTACTSTSRCRRARRTRPGCSSARSSRRVVAQKHPKVATDERSVRRARQARLHRLPAEHPRQDAGDRLQRARQRLRGRLDARRVEEIEQGFDRREFTIRTVPPRLAEVGDLWAALMKSKGVDLVAVTKVKSQKSKVESQKLKSQRPKMEGSEVRTSF